MENSFITALSMSVMAAAATSLGIYTIRRYAQWGQHNASYFMCFAAGIIISASFLHIIPKSLSMNSSAPGYILAGFFVLHVFNRFVTAFVCEKNIENKEYTIGVIPMLGIGFHSFIDGFTYSITFNIDFFTGILATFGMVLHEFPEGIVTYLLLARAGFSRQKSLVFSFLAAALTTPLGMLVSYPFVTQISGQPLGALLSLSAGALIYVGATHLLPEAEDDQKKYSILALTAGVMAAVVIVALKP
ncbi:MAG: ZIP family metal transporter [Desulfotignum sp.]